MLYSIILCLCVRLSGVLCYYLNKEEGAECEWEGRIGKCVKETRCLTTLDEDSPKHPVCSKKGTESIICCTDCQLVDNTKNAVFSPTSGLYWKTGQKARDSCLQYLEELPHRCKQDGYYGGISRQLDEENNCYTHYEWAVEGEPDKDRKPSAKYPYQVKLGDGEDVETANWVAGGFIISDKFIVTSAQVIYYFQTGDIDQPKFVAMGVKNLSDSPSTWQIRKIKRIIYHLEFNHLIKYHDIALIETDTPIKFDENVLPACLHVEEDAYFNNAFTTDWYNLERSHDELADTIETKYKELSEQQCYADYSTLISPIHEYNNTIQMCYGSKSKKIKHCLKWPGDPLMITTQFSSCVHTAIGANIFRARFNCETRTTPKFKVFTRIAYYVPWIESIVWP